MSPSKMQDRTVAFISDWQKRSARQQRRFVLILTVVLILSAIITEIGFFWFQENNYDRIVDQNRNHLQDSAIQEANNVERELNNAVKVVGKFAGQYALLVEEFADLTVEERLHILWDSTLFDRVGFITPEGIDLSVSGTCDVSDRLYFKKAMDGECGYELLEQSRLTEHSALIFYAPVKLKGEIIGVLVGTYDQKRIGELLPYQVLNYETRTLLLQANGTVMASSDLEDAYLGKNMLDRLKEKNLSEDADYDEILAAIADSDRTSISFVFTENGKTSVGVIAQFENSDLMVMSILPGDVTSGMTSGADHSGRMLMIVISVAFMLLIVLLVVFLVMQRKRLKTEMSFATDSLQTALRHDQKQSFIVESLGNTYSSVYYVDIAGNHYERIKEGEASVMTILDEGEWYAAYTGYVEHFVHTTSREKMLALRDLQSVTAFLENPEEKDVLAIEYQREDKGWRKAFMIPAERDENGKVRTAIFAVQKIELQKQKELDTQLALKEAYEAARLASNAKTTFLSNISHDIRTPMNAIVGMTAIATSNLDNREKVTDCLRKITASSKHLLGLINEVLDMSKIESGNVDLNEEAFSLSDLIDELITINQPLIREKNHTLLVRVDHLTHEKVIGDSTRLQQVFTNLLTNAIKYTPAGGQIHITVSEKQTNKPTIGWYEVIFRDNGIGMSEEFQQRMFEPFSRAKDDRISTIQGTGLGMPIARNIVRMMNGDITVSSKINEGSTFTVSFALRLQQEEEVRYEDFVDLPVLVVDDDPVACESTCTILDSLSMKSEFVLSGKEAIEKTQQRHERDEDYYAVVIDWRMPEMNGVETAREIRKRIGDDVPIIVISAYDWTDIEEEARAAGVNAFLGKPLFKSRVVDLFSELVGGKTEKAEPVAAVADGHFPGKRVLLAEDNLLNREIATEILHMMGLEVECAEDGKECYERFLQSEAGYYDLIFMDIQMPVMNGYDATRAIRSSGHTDAKRIPIVAMTANAFSTDVRAAFDAGMNEHISKPIDIPSLTKVLRTYL